MRKKNGFVFIETIITIVFLAAALLILYGSYRNAITDEKTKIYYDDIGYLYRNYYLADFLVNKTEINDTKESIFSDRYAVEVNNSLYNDLFSTYQVQEGYPNELEAIITQFNVEKAMIVSDEVIINCFNNNDAKCDKSYEGLSEGLTRYIETMNVEREEDDRVNYYLVTEYKEKTGDNGAEKCNENEEGCNTFYATLKLDINKEIVVEPSTIGEVCKGKNFAECLKDNNELENDDDNGLFHHDKDGEDSGYGNDEAGDNSYRYGGKDVKNYICFGSDNEKCPDESMYRIIGVYGNQIKIIKNSDSKNNWNGVKTKDAIVSSLASKWQDMIAKSDWNTVGFSRTELSKDAKGIYATEIKGAKESNKVGLMYVNEYMYGASPKYWETSANNYSVAKDNNWLYQGETEWSISKDTTGIYAFAINDVGNVGYNPISRSSIGRVSMYLTDTVMLVSGSGTYEDPYRVNDTGVVITKLEKTNDDYYQIDVKASGNSLKGEILRYDFKIKKNGVWSDWVESTDGTYSFKDLVSNTEYPIIVRALNSEGNYSDEVEETFKTKYKEPEVKSLTPGVIGWHQASVTASGNNGSGYITGYCYVIKEGRVSSVGDNEYSCENSLSLSHSKTFTDLKSGTTYTIFVKVVDNNGYKSLNNGRIEVTIGSEPNINVNGNENWTNQDVTVSGGTTGGTGNIDMYYCRDQYDCTPSTPGDSVYDNTTGIEKFCFSARNRDTGEYTSAKCTNTYIDRTPPSCTVGNENGSWKNTDHAITLGCIDGESGCNPWYPTNSTQTFNYTVGVANVSTFEIWDLAGNKTDCNVTANVYIDKTAPTCTSLGGNVNFVDYNVTITGTCSDDHSGCQGNVSKTYTRDIETYESPGTVYDNVGNSTKCSEQYVRIRKNPGCANYNSSYNGWTQIGTDWYYYQNGCALTGWIQNWEYSCSTGWYYLDPNDNGKMVVGWKQVDGLWYYLSKGENNYEGVYQAQGCMYAGWLRNYDFDCESGWWYLYWKTMDGHVSGQMRNSGEQDGYKFYSNGCAYKAGGGSFTPPSGGGDSGGCSNYRYYHYKDYSYTVDRDSGCVFCDSSGALSTCQALYGSNLCAPSPC